MAENAFHKSDDSDLRICLSSRPEKARVIAYICDHSEELADMWHGTLHGPDTLDFSRISKQNHVRTCAHMCAHVSVRFGDVAVLLRNSKDQKENKKVSEDGEKLIRVLKGQRDSTCKPWRSIPS